ncbi:MAG: DUF2062 domain-containing protein [Eubacteriales bacterium]
MRLNRYFKYQYYKMLRLKDTPSKVAQGIGMGFAMDFAVPIPFVSIFVAFVVARILKLNSLAAVMSAAALKPFFLAIVAINIYIQDILVSAVPPLRRIVLPHPAGTNYLEQVINSILTRGVPYLMAGLINGCVIFIISYLIVYSVLKVRIQKLKAKRLNKKPF